MNKRIIIILAISAALIIGGIIFVRLFSAEDSWICTGGQWVRHGNPKATMPNGGCQK
jgi:hypothetical protein